MTPTQYALWLEMGSGQRHLIATSSSRTFALLLGEAVWARFCPLRATALDLRMVEIQEGAATMPTETPHIIARWSDLDGEQGEKQHPKREEPQKPPCTPSTVTRIVAVPPPASEDEQDEESSLAAFFPTEQEWTVWQDGWGGQAQ